MIRERAWVLRYTYIGCLVGFDMLVDLIVVY